MDFSRAAAYQRNVSRNARLTIAETNDARHKATKINTPTLPINSSNSAASNETGMPLQSRTALRSGETHHN
jgi:hypothetical protein